MPEESAPPEPSRLVDAVPSPFPLPLEHTALVVIDMQRDFLLPGGFGETLGNDVGQLRRGSCLRCNGSWPPPEPPG